MVFKIDRRILLHSSQNLKIFGPPEETTTRVTLPRRRIWRQTFTLFDARWRNGAFRPFYSRKSLSPSCKTSERDCRSSKASIRYQVGIEWLEPEWFSCSPQCIPVERRSISSRVRRLPLDIGGPYAKSWRRFMRLGKPYLFAGRYLFHLFYKHSKKEGRVFA